MKKKLVIDRLIGERVASEERKTAFFSRELKHFIQQFNDV